MANCFQNKFLLLLFVTRHEIDTSYLLLCACLGRRFIDKIAAAKQQRVFLAAFAAAIRKASYIVGGCVGQK